MMFPKPVKKKNQIIKTKLKRKVKTQSIMQFDKECYFKDKIPHICDGTLEEHHTLFGNPNRKYSEEDGLKIYSCPKMHRGESGVHQNKKLDLVVKLHAQLVYESEIGTREQFMKRYGKNYIYGDNVHEKL